MIFFVKVILTSIIKPVVISNIMICPPTINQEELEASDHSLMRDENLLIQNDDSLMRDESLLKQINDFLIQSDDFLIQSDDFLMKDDDFLMKDDDFLMKDDDFLMKDDDFLMKDDDFLMGDESLLILNDGSPILNKNYQESQINELEWEKDPADLFNLYRSILASIQNTNRRDSEIILFTPDNVRYEFDESSFNKYYKLRNKFYIWSSKVKSVIEKDIKHIIDLINNEDLPSEVAKDGLTLLKECLEEVLKFKLSQKKYFSCPKYIINYNMALRTRITNFFTEIPFIGIFLLIDIQLKKNNMSLEISKNLSKLEKSLYRIINNQKSVLANIDLMNQLLNDLIFQSNFRIKF